MYAFSNRICLTCTVQMISRELGHMTAFITGRRNINNIRCTEGTFVDTRFVRKTEK